MWAPGERASIVKRDDNLQPEGKFTKRPDGLWAPGERANVIRRDDNLHPKGDFTKRPDGKWALGERAEERAPGERADIVKRDDNLQFKETLPKTRCKRANVIEHDDNLRPEGDFTKDLTQKRSDSKLRENFIKEKVKHGKLVRGQK